LSDLPSWFLIGALFLPRICLLGGYLAHVPPVASLSGFLPIAMAVLVPRIVVILLIYSTLGWTWWLVPHCLALSFVCAAAGRGKR
jgi:hypothetical protein